MEIIEKLIEIITPNKLKGINLITNLKEDSKLKKLYMGYHEKKWKNDDEAIAELYGANAKRDTFFKLKHDLYEKLMQVFPLINFTENEQLEQRRAYWECQTNFHIGNLFAFLGTNSSIAFTILEKNLAKSIKYEFTNIVSESASILGAYSKTIKIDKKKAAGYDAMAYNYVMLRMAEVKGRMYLSDIYSYYAMSTATKTDVPSQIKEYLDDLEKIPLQVYSQKFIYYKKMLGVMYWMSQYNYRETIKECTEAIAYFEKSAFIDVTNLRSFYFQLIPSYTYCGEFELAKHNMGKCLAVIQKGTFSWFKAQEANMQLALYSERYQDAYSIYQDVIADKNYNTKSIESLRQIWTLYEAYLYVFKEMGLLSIAEGEKLHVRFQALLNKVPVLTHDKKGYNFTMYILHLFYILLKNDKNAQDTYEERMDALRKYTQRYENTDKVTRSRYMVELLEGIARNAFKTNAIRKDKTVIAFLHRLKTEDFDITDANLDLEPVPFPRIFDFLLGIIDRVYRPSPSFR